MHVDKKLVKCGGITCCRYMAVCMYLCSSPGSPCDAPGDVSGHSIGLTSSKSETQNNHTNFSKISCKSREVKAHGQGHGPGEHGSGTYSAGMCRLSTLLSWCPPGLGIPDLYLN